MDYCVTALLFSGVVFTSGLYLFQSLADGGATHGYSRTRHPADTTCPPPGAGLGRAGATVSLVGGPAGHGGLCHLETKLDRLARPGRRDAARVGYFPAAVGLLWQ